MHTQQDKHCHALWVHAACKHQTAWGRMQLPPFWAGRRCFCAAFACSTHAHASNDTSAQTQAGAVAADCKYCLQPGHDLVCLMLPPASVMSHLLACCASDSEKALAQCVSYSGLLHCIALCGAVLCCGAQCCAALRCGVQCRAVLRCAVLCCAVLCCAVLRCAVLCCALLCCAVLCCAQRRTHG